MSETAIIHGRSVSYTQAGSGPVLLLIHGMAGDASHWEPVLDMLARDHTVIAPDLPGHGRSEPGGGDYSLGSLATGLRDLLLTLGHDRVTLVGHSLGGGIAMQFTYQFPEMVERLVLVSSGGLGTEVSAVLRAASLPGADRFIGVTAGVGGAVGSLVGRGLGLVGLRPTPDVAEVARSYAALADSERRKAFLATVHSVIGTGGQRIAAEDRLYLTKGLPLLIVWGAEDSIIPAEHGELAHMAMPESRLVIFEGVGHQAQVEAPGRFVMAVQRFLAETEPARFDRDEWRALFKTA